MDDRIARTDCNRTLADVDFLTFRGPSVYEGLTPSTLAQNPNSPNLPPLRPLCQSLLAPSGPAFSKKTWTIELLELNGDFGRYQSWKVNVKRSVLSLEGHTLSLLLTRPGIWAKSSNDRYVNAMGRTIMEFVEVTAAHYKQFANLQGRELTACYGLFLFDLPDEPQCFGFLVEDPEVTQVEEWVQQVQETSTSRPVIEVGLPEGRIAVSVEIFDLILRGQRQLHRRLAEFSPDFVTWAFAGFVLNSSTTNDMRFVISMFDIPEPIDHVNERNKRLLKEYEARERRGVMERTGESEETIMELMRYMWQFGQPDENICETLVKYLQVRKRFGLQW